MAVGREAERKPRSRDAERKESRFMRSCMSAAVLILLFATATALKAAIAPFADLDWSLTQAGR